VGSLRLLVRWVAALALILVVALASAVASAWLSLDRDYAHTRAAEALPLWTPDTSEALVSIEARGMRFRARVAGLDQDGPAVILLHGFPETSIMWERLIPAAAEAGFRVVAFDQRGYSPGARPDGIDAYRMPELTADVFAIADAVGFERFHLVGHDWGAVVGWVTAGLAPDRVLTYAVLSIPHPEAIRTANADRGVPGYVRLFQTPGVPETMLTSGGLFMMRGLYGSMPQSQLDEYLAVFSEPGGLTSALNWYRAREEFLSGGPIAEDVTQPVLYVFGNRDMPVFVRPEVRELQPRFATGPFEEVELDAGHWLIQEEPAAVVDAVMAHLELNRDRD
jgi:pimeloyl-ACP methyl ester carboxylesterase